MTANNRVTPIGCLVAGLALACVHLAGKATDAPARLTHVLEHARDPKRGVMGRRHWPLAAPWRDTVLAGEQRRPSNLGDADPLAIDDRSDSVERFRGLGERRWRKEQ